MLETEHGNLAYDSERQYIGNVYAKSLLAAADKQNAMDSVLGEFDAFVEVLRSLPKLEATLSSPRVPLEAKESIIDKALSGASKTLVHFVKVLCRHGRFDCLRVVHRTAQALYDDAAGRIELTMITADPVEESVRLQVADKVAKLLSREVRVRAKVDSTIIGGLVIRVGDTVYDGSVANQLQQLRKVAIDQAVHEIRQSTDRFVVEA